MDENKKKNLKIIIPVISFSAVMLLVAIILLAVLISRRNKPQNKTVESVSFNVNTDTNNGKKYKNSAFNFLDTDEIAFTKADFNVIINYSDSTFESTSSYTIEVIEENEVPTSVKLKYDDTYKRIFPINVESTKSNLINLGLFKNTKKYPEISVHEHAYRYTKELRWDEEAIDVTNLFVLGDDTTLCSLIQSNKVSVIHSYESLSFNAPESYSIIINAKDGYTFSEEGEEFDSILLFFTIKRKIIELPVLTSTSTFEYSYNENTLEGIKQGLTFDYMGRDNLITRPRTESEVGTYVTRLTIIDSNKYAFLVNGEEVFSTEEYTFTITRKALDIDEFKIEDEAHYDLMSNSYRYSYTGSNIIPGNNISDSVKKLLNISAGAINSSIDVQVLTIEFKDLSSYEDENHKTYLKNFTWANGQKIEVKEYSLSYYVDKADASIPDYIKSTLSLRSLKYRQDLTCASYSISTTIKDNSWFSPTSFDTLEANNIPLNAFSLYDSSIGLRVGENTVRVIYCPDSNNYNPLELALITDISKGIANIDFAFNLDTKQFALWCDVSSVEVNVTYKYYLVNSDNTTGSEASNITDAGNYRVVAPIEENDFYEFYLENVKVTDVIYDFSVPRTVLYLGYNASYCWSNVTKTNVHRTTPTNPEETDWGWADVYDNIPNLNTITFYPKKLGYKLTVEHTDILDYIEFENVTMQFKYVIRDINGNGEIEGTEPDDQWHFYPDVAVSYPYYAVYKVSVSYKFKDGINENNYKIVNDAEGEEETSKRINLYFRVYPSVLQVELEDTTADNYIGYSPTNTFTYHTYDHERYPEYVYNTPTSIIKDDAYFPLEGDNYTIAFPQEPGTYQVFHVLSLNPLVMGEDTKMKLTKNGVQDGSLVTPDPEDGSFYISEKQTYTILE
ncbi:MAG: hypothetical protein K6F59_03515 [Gammaproteobacteria bacterium]|nr:hypothetical protein [Gammaproteobacteria bacterium]